MLKLAEKADPPHASLYSEPLLNELMKQLPIPDLPLSTPRLATQIEAILYLKGQAMTLGAIAECVGSPRKAVKDALLELMDDYAHRDSALEIVETPIGYSLQLRETFQNLMHHLVPAELGTGALRTLAAIALKSPVLQTELIELRGSSAYQQVQELVQFGFIRKRRQAEGRSYWLEVTPKFHQYFEVDELSQILRQHRSSLEQTAEED